MLNHQYTLRNTTAQEVASNTSAMLAYWDKNLICRFANRAYLDWFGRSPEEMIDKMSLSQLLGPLFEKNLPFIKLALEGKMQIFERDITTPNGERRHSLATYTPDIAAGEVEGFYVHVADITELKIGISRDNRKQLEEKDISLPENLVNAVDRTLRFHLFLPFPGIAFLAQKHHVSESKLKRDFKLKHQKTIFNYFRKLQMEIADAYITEKRYSKKQLASMLKFSNPSNFLTCYHKYLKEKTTQKIIEGLERASEDFSKTFILQAPVAIAMFDIDLNLLAASQLWLKDFNLEERVTAKVNFYDFFPGVAEHWKVVHQQCIEGTTDIGEEHFTREDGSSWWLKWNIRCWLNAKQQPGGLIIFTEDITLAKQKEADNKRILKILVETSEISRIGVWERNLKYNTVFWNKITYEILEVPESELPSAHPALHFYTNEKERSMIIKYIEMARLHGESFDFKAEITTAKGNKKMLRVIGLTEMKDGVCERLYGIFQEII